jgi:hypothetical protein
MVNEIEEAGIEYKDLCVIQHATIEGWYVAGEAKGLVYYAQGLDRAAAFTKDHADFFAKTYGGLVSPIEQVKGQFIGPDGQWIPRNLA